MVYGNGILQVMLTPSVLGAMRAAGASVEGPEDLASCTVREVRKGGFGCKALRWCERRRT